MPTYEFRCQNGHTFQRFYKSISGSDMTLPCPECGAVGARLLSGGAGLVFKGSGFYLTDYGKNAHRGSPAGTGAGDKASDKSGEGKSEGGKPEPAKSDGGAAQPAAKPESPKPKAESAKPSTPSSKPKSE